MGLIRLLSLLLLASAAWYLYRNFMRRPLKQQSSRTTGPVPVVKCSHCDLHLPRHQALDHGAEWFCTQAHRQAWLDKRDGKRPSP